MVTALVDNEVGHLVEELILAGGVDASGIVVGAVLTASAARSATA